MRAHIFKLKLLLIAFTITVIAYVYIIFYQTTLWFYLGRTYYTSIVIPVIQLFISLTLIRFNWKYFPVSKAKKWENTFMILLLGVVGMWLWLPTKKEMDKMNFI